MNKFTPSPLGAARLRDRVLAPRITACREVTIPSSLRRCDETGRLAAFRLEWKPGMPNPPHRFWDSDVAKVLEGMAYMLRLAPDPAMEAELERLIALVISAQQPDGYLNTRYTVVEPELRWVNLGINHELYCAGHLIEAAVAHFEVTGRRNFLDAMCRYADYIATVFGRGPGQKRGYPGHEELELALCRLARVTGNPKYSDLAAYFVNERGRSPNYFAEIEHSVPAEKLYQEQAHLPVRDQHEAVGHSVRAVYLYCGMADVAAATGDAGLMKACEELFDDIVSSKMYITGGIGSLRENERFGVSYQLPNDSAYAESCAAIGLALFARRMHNLTGDGKYMDVLERSLYNGILSGLGLTGDVYFYQNMLEVNECSPYDRTRVPWFSCSCCPTNFCRFLPQLGTLAWSVREGELRLNLPAAADYDDGRCRFEVRGGYPYDGRIAITCRCTGSFAFSLRIPGWCRRFTLRFNGRRLRAAAERGYVTLERDWQPGDRIELELAMPVEVVRAAAPVRADAGRVALTRGPLVYAVESADNPGGFHQLLVDARSGFTLGSVKGLPAGTVAIRGRGRREILNSDALYTTNRPKFRSCRFTAVPYALWQNRGEGEMAVWLREWF